MENKADNLCGGTYSAFSSPNEILSERDSCMSCSMHRIRSCAHVLFLQEQIKDIIIIIIFAQRSGERDASRSDRNVEEAFQGLDSFI